MVKVNSRRECRASERHFELPAPAHGAQPSAKNSRIPRLFGADRPAERLSPGGVLAGQAGFELSVNALLRCYHICGEQGTYRC